jgi:hypothetical protein
MGRRNHEPPDPLDCIPSASVIRVSLRELEVRCKRMRILLEVAERIEAATAENGDSEVDRPYPVEGRPRV